VLGLENRLVTLYEGDGNVPVLKEGQCVCVCVCVCVYACVYVCVYECVCICVCVYCM